MKTLQRRRGAGTYRLCQCCNKRSGFANRVRYIGWVTDKGKPVARLGRKAKGLGDRRDSQVTEVVQSPLIPKELIYEAR